MSKSKVRGGTGTPATLALTAAGVSYELHAYDHDPAAASYGREAAHALGVPPGRVFKTLLAETDQQLVVGIVPVSGSLDLKALAAVTGSKRATLADPATAQRVTGYVLGGISPIGQRKVMPTVVETTALEFDTIFVSAGRRGLEIELAPPDLIRVTDAVTASIGRPD